MKTFKSSYLDNSLVPLDFQIYDSLSYVGYDGFIPKSFIADLLILSKCKLFSIPYKTDNKYVKSVSNIIKETSIEYWLNDTMYLLKRISQQCDLRIIEELASKGKAFNIKDVPFSYNYKFELKNINPYIIKLLNITDRQIDQIEKLSDDVIEVLTIANSLGSFLKTSKTIEPSSKQMTSYGEIVKVHKHNFSDPLFDYKLSTKQFMIDNDTISTKKSSKIVVGFFLGNYRRRELAPMLIKLLGTILISNYIDDVKIIVYSFFTDTYSKQELSTVEEIINYFTSPQQFKIFPIDNSKAIKVMITENLGDDIVYMPNVVGGCKLDSQYSGTNRVNIISVQESEFNGQYQNICTKTGGRFIIV